MVQCACVVSGCCLPELSIPGSLPINDHPATDSLQSARGYLGLVGQTERRLLAAVGWEFDGSVCLRLS